MSRITQVAADTVAVASHQNGLIDIVNEGTIEEFASVAALKAVDQTSYSYIQWAYITALNKIYRWDSTSTATADDVFIIKPTATTTGRWLIFNSGGSFFHKFTSDETWTITSSLGAENIVEYMIDALSMTAGVVYVEIDGEVVSTVSSGLLGEIAADTSPFDGSTPDALEVKVIKDALLKLKGVTTASASIAVVAADTIAEAENFGSPTNTSSAVTSNVSSPYGISVVNSGQYVFLMDQSDDVLHRYSLSTPYNASTESFDTGEEYDTTSQNANMIDVVMKEDGTKFITLGTDGNDTLYEYTCSTPYQLSSGVSFVQSFDVSGISTEMQALDISADGKTILLSAGSANMEIYKVNLPTAWSLTGASDSGESLSDTPNEPRGIAIDPTGTRIVHLRDDGTTHRAYTRDLADPLDLTTQVNNESFLDISGHNSAPRGGCIASDGTNIYFYCIDGSADTFAQYTVTESFAGTVCASVNYGT